MRHYEQIASVLHFRVFFKTFFDCLAVNPCFYALKTMSDIVFAICAYRKNGSQRAKKYGVTQLILLLLHTDIISQQKTYT